MYLKKLHNTTKFSFIVYLCFAKALFAFVCIKVFKISISDTVDSIFKSCALMQFVFIKGLGL